MRSSLQQKKNALKISVPSVLAEQLRSHTSAENKTLMSRDKKQSLVRPRTTLDISKERLRLSEVPEIQMNDLEA